ncbi:MAG TPA: excinuclease ABC subunit A, partial [Allocoleopsis sp.]
RISEGVEQALNVGEGRIVIIDVKLSEKQNKHSNKEMERGIGETVYTTHGACPNHPEVVFEPLEPRMFSFNSPFGACAECHGLGEIQQISEDLVIPDKSKSVMDGAIAVYGKMDISWRAQQIAAVGKKYGFDVFTPIEKFTEKQLHVLLYGTQEAINAKWSTGASMNFNNGWEGIIPQTMRLYKQTESEWRKEEMEKFMVSKLCQTCDGKRLKDIVLSVKIAKQSIIDVTNYSIDDAITFFQNLGKTLNDKEMFIAKQVLKEINERLGFMKNVGLGYLSLSRSARTLSGGEAQRIRLATQVGSNLMGVMYILDEPSIGLHQRDNEKLINTLHRLRDIGNTLIVVEHDEDTIKRADYLIDMGPGAGIHGGHITAHGTIAEVSKNKNSITGDYISGRRKIDIPKTRRKSSNKIKVVGVSENNLKNFNVELPLGVLCAITGVSGSGKSTLMNQTLMPYMKKYFGEQVDKIG